MVVFTCSHCGDTLQKPKVDKHYQFKCRNTPFLTCVDCLKDFRGEEYVAHTKCITEAERYSGKDYVPKPSANKGERKQQEWIGVVNNLLNGPTDLSNAERNFLNSLSKYENIPRKKPKFLNFIRNAMGNRVNTNVLENVWNKMENAHKQNQQSVSRERDVQTVQTREENNANDRTSNQNMDSNNLLDTENIIENQNNENIYKENNSAECQNGNNEAHEINGNDTCEKRTKSKKRSLKSKNVQITEENEPVAKISKTSSLEVNANDSESAVFDWKNIILTIVQNKGEVSLKKLQSKIIKKYTNHICNLSDISKLTDEEHEKAIAKFNKALKKLKKTFALCILEDKVKLS
ncbi:cell growth-regulating nucleolar protein [Linepithema humile]|uniref:cell growth-regulating nucleolar protein n=1 Tax=Linepithema humile TaxID=83485 RepID=UPI0006239172|nr:PREDICTED: cell growth-regulating nucleolar protein [Linepithema humile]